MPVPIGMLRAVLVLLAMLFGFMLGRSAARVRRGAQGRRSMFGWAVRTLLAVAAASWGHGVDSVVAILLALLVLAVAGGAWTELRPRKPPEDLTRQIFPE